MFKSAFFAVSVMLLVYGLTARAQTSTPLATHIGTATGKVRDTAQNYILKSATVSIYKAADSSLLSYQITNNYGEFKFKNLPVNLALRLQISNIGYGTARKDFKIPEGKNTIDLQTVVMTRQEILLEDVVISVPPITMNGDTLEFNASAFKLDSNATVEDMLKSIENVTLWGDGKITVNGAEVKSLKVNGKSFFGGDAKLALQNISKDALQKVQVYNTAKDISKPLDSTLEMNLKLKKGKDIGYFGKIGAGYGTRKRFETDASFNMFTPKMQLALVGAINNINKIPGSVGNMMVNSTYKGVGTNIGYQPDFRMSGINRTSAAGASFTYNFIENPEYERKSTLRGNYFLQGMDSDELSDVLSTTIVNANEKIFENNRSTTSSNTTTHRFDSQYEYAQPGKSLNISQALNVNQGESMNQTLRSAGNLSNPLTSTNNSVNTNTHTNKSFNLNGSYRYYPYISMKRFRGFNLDYQLSANQGDSKQSNQTSFKSFINPAENRDFDRRYNTRTEGLQQSFGLTVQDIKSLIFGDMKLAGINIDLTNNLSLRSNKNDNEVEDLDTLTKNYRPNVYLNNSVQTTVIEETPGLSISKGFYKNLSNRFNKGIRLSFQPKVLFIAQENKSDRSFQNINRRYNRIAPDASINMNDSQDSEYYRSLNINYNTTLQTPDIQQLAPLTDSTNLYFLQRGNVNLKAAVQQQVILNFNHYDQRNKNTFNYDFLFSFGFVKRTITDSSLLDDQNRRTVYLVNAEGKRFMNLRIGFNKALKFKSSELQFNAGGGLNADRNPSYMNNVFTYSSNLNTNMNAGINYTLKSILAVALTQNFDTYNSKQEAFDTKYSGKNISTTLSSNYNLTKRLTLNSNISFNQSSSSNAENINFTIWNANATYRFLKGNNLELKLSALDLLRQNNNVINYGGYNMYTVGTRNVLQQYFMTTVSYYPRQFGKKKKG